MSDAARAKALELLHKTDGFRPDVRMLADALDAYAAEQTAALRARAERAEALVARLRDHILDAIVVFGLEGTRWREIADQLLADAAAARLVSREMHGPECGEGCGILHDDEGCPAVEPRRSCTPAGGGMSRRVGQLTAALRDMIQGRGV